MAGLGSVGLVFFFFFFCNEIQTVKRVSRSLSLSLTQKTHAAHRLQDDVPPEEKRRRLEECIAAFREEAAKVNAALIGSTQLVLVEGVSTARIFFLLDV